MMIRNDQMSRDHMNPSILRSSIMRATSTVCATAMAYFPPACARRLADEPLFSCFFHYPPRPDPGQTGTRLAHPRPLPPCPSGRGALYSGYMEIVLPILVVLAMLAVLASLFGGIINMAIGGDPKRSNMFMRYRVWLQGLALLLFAVFMMLYRR